MVEMIYLKLTRGWLVTFVLENHLQFKKFNIRLMEFDQPNKKNVN